MIENNKKIITSIIFLVVFIVGYVRETFFLSVNGIINNYEHRDSYVTLPDSFYDYSETTLSNIKWIFTFVFSLIFMGLCSLIVKIYFGNKRWLTYTLLIYASLLIVSFVLAIFGMIFDIFQSLYSVMRFFMGLAQSPLTVLVIFTVFYFIGSNKKLKLGK